MLGTPIRYCLCAPMLLLAACAPSSTPDPVKGGEEIRALDEKWSATAGRNDVDATVAFYAPDAVLLPPNAALAKDAKAIRESWAGLLGPNTAVSWKPTRIEVAKSGELGYLYGTYQLTIKDPMGGPSIEDKGKILEVWKRQADGEWKCIVDTYNSDLPLPEPSK